MYKNKTIKWCCGRTTRYKVFANQLNKLKSVEKLHPLKSQLIFSEVSHSEWSEPFDFPSLIFGFACKYPWFVCCLSVFCVVRSSYIYFQCCYYYYSFFFFFNWWSVCNFTEYVRRLDEILAQKIEKFTQLRGKTASLTFFQCILVSLLLRQTPSFMLLGRFQGGIFKLWTKPYFRSSLLSTRVRCARRLEIILIGEKKVGHKKVKLDLLRLGHSHRQDPSLFSYTALSTKRHWERNWTSDWFMPCVCCVSFFVLLES